MADIPRRLIETVWNIYTSAMEGSGIETSKLDFICGVNACLGIMTGTMELGIPEHTDPTRLLVQLLEEVQTYRPELERLEEIARQRTHRRNLQ
jgi:hypothetical protein